MEICQYVDVINVKILVNPRWIPYKHIILRTSYLSNFISRLSNSHWQVSLASIINHTCLSGWYVSYQHMMPLPFLFVYLLLEIQSLNVLQKHPESLLSALFVELRIFKFLTKLIRLFQTLFEFFHRFFEDSYLSFWFFEHLQNRRILHVMLLNCVFCFDVFYDCFSELQCHFE